jgi:hypothetical protein
MNGADSNGYTGFKLSTDGKTFWVPVTINTTGSQSTSTFLIYEYSLVNGVWGKTLTGCDPLRTNTSGNGNTAACYFDMTADGQYLIFPSANNDRTIVLFKKRSGIYRRMDANTEFEIFPSTSNEKIASFNYTKNGLGVFVTSYDVNNSTGYYVSRTYQISVSANVWLLAGKKLVATIDSSTTVALNKREQLRYTPLVTNNGNTCVSMIMRFVPDGGTIGGSPTYYIQNFADVRTVNKSGAWALSYSIKLPSYNPDRKYSIPSFNALYLTAPAALSDKAESLAIGTMSYNYDGMSNKPVASQSASLPQIYSYTTQDLFVYKDK